MPTPRDLRTGWLLGCSRRRVLVTYLFFAKSLVYQCRPMCTNHIQYMQCTLYFFWPKWSGGYSQRLGLRLWVHIQTKHSTSKTRMWKTRCLWLGNRQLENQQLQRCFGLWDLSRTGPGTLPRCWSPASIGHDRHLETAVGSYNTLSVWSDWFDSRFEEHKQTSHSSRGNT